MNKNLQFNVSAINAGECISQGWNLITQNLGLYVAIALVGFILTGCIPIVSLFLAGPILCGIYYVLIKQLKAEPIEFGMMFKGFDTFVPAMVVGIIMAIPEIIGQGIRISVDLANIGLNSGSYYQSDETKIALASGIMIFAIIVGLVLLIGGIALRLSLFFALPLIAEHQLGAIDAMKLSATAAWKNVGGIILLFILEFFVALAGLLALCVGLLVAIPVIYAANVYAYRQVFPDISSGAPDIPPPPTEYGDMFGQTT